LGRCIHKGERKKYPAREAPGRTGSLLTRLALLNGTERDGLLSQILLAQKDGTLREQP
jgi:hypothetical protein